MPTAYAYLRYSSKAQGGDDKDSIDRQMASIRALTAHYGVDLLPENIYRDDGISSFDGSNKKTGKLKDLIDLILNQSIKEGDIVFVESIDRLSRQKFRLSKELVYSILDKGVILITTIDNRIYQKTDDNSK
ncbi:recombinase family protein [Pseudomonas aeruginosa]